jgi:hypothetical protein
MPLPERATALTQWFQTHPSATDANVSYWLFQHTWIVDGARFGWWRGAEALQLLIGADHRAEQLWAIGWRSEKIARTALVEVTAKTH